MVLLLLGLALFFGTHLYSAFRSRAPGRDLRVRLGMGPYMGLYSLVSGAGFVLMILGYGEARYAVTMYQPPAWGALVLPVVMVPAMVLLAAAYVPNGRIKAAVRHPMLSGVFLWASGHLLANGDLASVLLFGSFALYAVIDFVAASAREGPVRSTDALPLVNDVIAVAVGVAAYAAVVWLHPMAFGVSALG